MRKKRAIAIRRAVSARYREGQTIEMADEQATEYRRAKKRYKRTGLMP